MLFTADVAPPLQLRKHMKESCVKRTPFVFIGCAMSLGDIYSLPTRSNFTFFQVFLNFWSNAPKCRHLGMCMLF